MQTAVEFLLKWINDNLSESLIPIHIKEQAKQMEKEQIINAFDEGQEYEYQVFVNSAPRFFSDTYYNETYGSKASDETKTN